MAIVLLIIGAVMVTAAVRNTVTTSGSQEGLTDLLEGDFAGQNNFIFWVVSILIIGGAGYIPGLKNLSNAFLVLVIVVLFLSKGGFFQQFENALNTTQTS
jgi:NADH:ubiquinone oxidoreductase subunit 6 (subunit J)